MDIIVEGILPFAIALVLASVYASKSFVYNCSHRGSHSRSILPPPAISTVRGTTAPSRTGECVRGRVLREPSGPLPSRFSMTAFTHAFARATTHAALLTAAHSMGNNQSDTVIFLRNWMLTTAYILTFTASATRASIEPTISDDVAFTADPSTNLEISIDIEYELRHLLRPEPARLSTRLSTRRRQTVL